ncbi:MAG TPA: glycerate-2-kinase family protein, partial [Nannocystaceae bacterium]|nr:glycerate-2-kinase family protein [Nannocystaceae bacterium]
MTSLAGRPLAGDVDALLAAALAAVDPGAWVRRHVVAEQRCVVIAGERYELDAHSRLHVAAVGKAAESTARALVVVLGELVTGGVAVIPAPASVARIGPIEVVAAGHPLPDAASEHAGRRLLDVSVRAHPGDLVLFAISGGASALACVPQRGITLAELRATTDLLARAGVDIATMNAVRGRLDRCKHGGLVRDCAARAVALVLVDVPDGDPRVVGSGPTFAPDRERTDAAITRAIAIAGADLPRFVRSALGRAGEAMPERGCAVHVLGDNAMAVAAARRAAMTRGYAIAECDPLVGEAREVGRALGARLAALARGPRPIASIVGGETTVTRDGGGRGGRTLELALAAADAIAGLDEVALVAFATDGRDGSSDATGAL